jgi:hypothetical protein
MRFVWAGATLLTLLTVPFLPFVVCPGSATALPPTKALLYFLHVFAQQA